MLQPLETVQAGKTASIFVQIVMPTFSLIPNEANMIDINVISLGINCSNESQTEYQFIFPRQGGIIKEAIDCNKS